MDITDRVAYLEGQIALLQSKIDAFVPPDIPGPPAADPPPADPQTEEAQPQAERTF